MRTSTHASHGNVGRAWVLAAIGYATASVAGGLNLDPTITTTSGFHWDSQGHRLRVAGGPLSPLPTPRGEGMANWTLLGPPGADVTVVAASATVPSLVFAGTAPEGSLGGSLYRSTDNGTTWSVVPAMAGKSVFDIQAAVGGEIYLATQNGVWESDDNGEAWAPLSLNIGNNNMVVSLAVDPGDPHILWAGIADAIGAQPINVMRSIDGGLTWLDKTPPHANPMTCTGIAADPNHSDTVVAVFGNALSGGEVWVTMDGGLTWTDRSAGLPANPLRTVAFDGEKLLIGGGVNFGSQDVGLYMSTDMGASWQALHDMTWPLKVVTDIAVDPGNPQTILATTDGAGVNRSTDGGATWEIGIGGTAGMAAQSLRYDPSIQNLYLATTSLGVFRSVDGGENFLASGGGMSELNLTSIASSPVDTRTIAVAFQGANSGGVYRSDDVGAHWTLEALPPTRFSSVGFSSEGTLYAISSGPTDIAPEGLYRRNSDASWTSLGPDQGPLFESNLATMRFSENDVGLILLGGGDFGVAGFASTIWRSADAGSTWSKVFLGGDQDFVTDIEIVEDGMDQSMVASYDGSNAPQFGGALRSDDGGLAWTPALSGLPSYAQQPHLCASPQHSRSFFLIALDDSSRGELYHTTDAGLSWNSTGWIGGVTKGIVCDPNAENVLYIAQFAPPRVSRSNDQGSTFTPFDAGLEFAGSPTTIAVAHAQSASPRLLLSTDRGSYATIITAADTIFGDGFER